MNLEKKHMIEHNRLCMIISVFIQLFMILSTILYKDGRNFSTVLMLVVEGLSLAATIVGYIKLRGNVIGHYPLLVSLAVSYLIVLLGSMHTPYLWAFGTLIGVAVVGYNDVKICKLGVLVAIVENAIYVIVFYASGAYLTSKSTYQVPTNMAFVLFFGITCYFAVRVTSRQIHETLDDIEEKNNQQLASAAKVKDTSEKIAAKLEDAHDAMSSLSDKVKVSAEAVEQISNSVSLTAEAIQVQTEKNSNIMDALREMQNESEEISALSGDVMDKVTKGNEVVTSLQAQAKKAGNINAQTAEMTEELAKSAETVKAIVSTILGISSQTNLLALNASIEAARAGDAGRGFAVVADEIRKLSEDTKTSAEQIQSTIDTLINNVHSASENMILSVETTAKQGEMINNTEATLAEILEAMKILEGSVKTINGSVQSCVSASSAVMDAITDLSATSEEVAASADSSLSLSVECTKDMSATNDILDAILGLSRSNL